MRKPKVTRYQQLDGVQRDRTSGKVVVVDPKLRSFVGSAIERPHFEKAFDQFKQIVQPYGSADQWILAFVLYANSPRRTSVLRFKNCAQFVRDGILAFLKGEGLEGLSLREIDTALVSRYLKWEKANCKGNGGRLEFGTIKNRWSMFKSLVLLVASSADGELLVSPGLHFPPVAFKGMGGPKNSRGFDCDEEFIYLYKCARKSALEILASYERDRGIVENCRSYQPVEPHTGLKRYPSREHALISTLPHLEKDAFFKLEDLEGDRGLFDSICNHGGFADVTMSMRPSAKNLFPFILLLGVYSQANTGPLRGLKIKNVTKIEVLGRGRYLFHLEKGRGIPYQRSYIDDPSDPLSPGEIFRFILRWTEPIRPFAGKYCDDLFIFYVRAGGVRAFKTAAVDGSDSDSLWDNALKDFCKKWSVPAFTYGDLRMTGLEIVRKIHDDDMRAVLAAGAQSSETVINTHYTGKRALQRANVALSQVSATLPRFVNTMGRSDPRGMNAKDDPLAATPGWGCLDPFSSPRAGQREGAICSAFGECPVCPLGTLDKQSAYALARVVQLREEVELARDYLNLVRWATAYADVLTALDEKWLPLFTDKSVRKRAAALSLSSIGRLE